MTFKTRLRLFLALVVMVPLVAIGAVLLSLVQDREVSKADARLETGMRVARTLYFDARREATDDARRLAADRVLRSALARGDDRAVGARMRQLVRADPDILSVAFADPKGRRVAKVGSSDGFAHAQRTVARQDGARAGTIAVSVTDADDLARDVRRRTGLDMAAVSDGSPVATTNAAVREVPSGRSEVRAPNGDGYRTQRLPVGTLTAVREELAIFQSTADVDAEVARKRLLVTGALVAFFIVALISALLVVRALRREIDGFLTAARRLAGGHFDERLPETGDDEFARLGREFNRMSEQLESKIDEVERKRRELEEAIRGVGKAFAHGLDAQVVFELTLQTAVRACEAECGHALPLDSTALREGRLGEDSPELERVLERAESAALTARSDAPETAARQIEMGSDEQPTVESAGAATRQEEPTAVELDGVHALALTLRVRLGASTVARSVGVISIARRGDAFTSEQAELLEYLAGQAVVSIENADLHETVQRQAVTDELTGLANARELQRVLDRELDRRRRFASSLSLILLDLDRFKSVNDTYGHQQGDEVLAQVARTIRDLCRDVDVPARYGGEELAVVLPQTDVAGAQLLAERMREAVEGLRVKRSDGEGEVSITASFGVAAVPACAEDKAALIAAADAALYQAKRAGRNRVVRAEGVTARR